MNSKILLLATFALALAFVSCSKDEPEDGGQDAKKVKNVVCTMSADFYELPEIADITITYFDEAGVSKSEVVTTRTWEKAFTTSTFPIKLTPQIVIKAKVGTPSKEKYDLGCASKISYTAIHTDGKSGQSHLDTGTPITNSFGYRVTSLDKFFEKNGNKNLELGGWILKLSSDGTTIVEE